jgi:hypothetical protein
MFTKLKKVKNSMPSGRFLFLRRNPNQNRVKKMASSTKIAKEQNDPGERSNVEVSRIVCSWKIF